MRLKLLCGIAPLLLTASCAKDKGPSTFSARFSGALSASFNGQGTTDVRYGPERPGTSTPGPVYFITLQVPEQVAGLEEYKGGAISFASLHEFVPGEYTAGSYGAIRPADSTVVGVAFAGRFDLLWTPIAGTLTMEKAKSKARRAGTFRLRFISFKTDRDTIEIVGAFDVRKRE